MKFIGFERRFLRKTGAPAFVDNLPNRFTVWRTRVGVYGALGFSIAHVAATWFHAGASWLWMAQAVFACYLVSAVGDLFDGTVARVRGETTLFGRWADPAADKLTVASAYVVVLIHQSMSWNVRWEFLLPVAGMVVYDLVIMNVRTYDASLRTQGVAKVKQFFIFFAMGAFLFTITQEEAVRARVDGELYRQWGLWFLYFILWGGDEARNLVDPGAHAARDFALSLAYRALWVAAFLCGVSTWFYYRQRGGSIHELLKCVPYKVRNVIISISLRGMF
jgi:phosphatidylglycerophosphate synthase